jgi:hypothetical protein
MSGFFNERMIDSGLLKTLNNMRERKWADEDIAKGIQAVRDVLIREYKELKCVLWAAFGLFLVEEIDRLLCSCGCDEQHHGALREGASNGKSELGAAAHG